jgi:hypothetical protein
MKSYPTSYSFLERGLQSTGRRSMSRRKRRILNLIGLLRWMGDGGSAGLISRERDGYCTGALAEAMGCTPAFRMRRGLQTAGRRSMSRRKRRILNYIL